MSPETVIYALAAGETRRAYEDIICAPGRTLTADEIERVKAAASADGWHSFRVWGWDGSAPDFSKGVSV